MAHPESTGGNNQLKGLSVEPAIEADNGIVTTEEEIEAYNIVKAILRASTDASRIVMRDTKSYCGVLLDDNNRKPLCRFHFNGKQKYIGLMTDKVEGRVAIDSIDDIFEHSTKLLDTLKEYE